MTAVIYRFGDFVLDVTNFALRRGDDTVSLQPKVFDVLRHLVEHADRVVTKDELLDVVWKDEHVSEAAVAWSVSHARRALGQVRGDKSPIDTVHGRGYRFVSPVLTEEPPAASPVRASSPPPVAAPTSQAPDPFVGRDAVLQQLARHLPEVRGGAGRMSVLTGEAGIGKTRVAQELAALASQAGVQVWTARCIDGVGAPAFWPCIQWLRKARGERPALADRAQALLGQLAAIDDPGDEQSGAGGRFWLLEGVVQLLLDAAREAPLLLVVDDLHWADPSTLELLRFLASELPSAALWVVATQRDGPAEADEATDRLRSALARHAEVVPLSPFALEDTERYFGAFVEGGAPPRSLSRAVHRAGAGNPLFIQETVRALLLEHGAWGLARIDPKVVQPPTVAHELLQPRLAMLDADQRSIVEAASVLGESFDLTLLQEVTAIEQDAIVAALEVAAGLGIVVAEAPHRYRFCHGLLRSLVYEGTAAADRTALHRRSGESLAARSGGEPAHGEIANHFHRSLSLGDFARVTELSLQAARAAEAVYAFADAATYYGWALEAQALDPEASPRARVELLMATGRAQSAAGAWGLARRTIRRALDITRPAGFHELTLQCVRLLRPSHVMSSVPDDLARSALEETLRALPEGPSAARVQALSLLSGVPPYAHDLARSRQLSAEALSLARQLDDPGPRLLAMRRSLYSHSGPDQVDSALELADELLQPETGGDSFTISEALRARQATLFLRGAIDDADRALDELLRVATEDRLAEAVWYGRRLQVQREISRGRFDAALVAIDDLHRSARRMGLEYGTQFVGMLRLHVAMQMMGIAQVIGNAEIAARLPTDGEMQVSTRVQFAYLRAMAGDLEQARECFEPLARRDFEDVPRDLAYLHALGNLGQLAIMLEDGERARQLHGLLLPYVGFNTPTVLMVSHGSVDHYLARLAAHLGDDAEAGERFAAAAALHDAWGMAPLSVVTRYRHARWLLDRGGEGAEEGRRLLGQVRDDAARLKMAWVQGATDDLPGQG